MSEFDEIIKTDLTTYYECSKYKKQNKMIKNLLKQFNETYELDNHELIEKIGVDNFNEDKYNLAKKIAKIFMYYKDYINFYYWVKKALETDYKDNGFGIFAVRFLRHHLYFNESQDLLNICVEKGDISSLFEQIIIKYQIGEYEIVIKMINTIFELQKDEKDNETLFYILSLSFLKLKQYIESSNNAIKCYLLNGKKSLNALSIIVECCEIVSSYDTISNLIIFEINNGITNVELLNNFFDKLNKNLIISVMVNSLINKIGSYLYYMDKYFFLICDYVRENEIDIDNEEINMFNKKVKLSDISLCEVCFSEENHFIKFKDIGRIQECQHGVCSECIKYILKCPFCRSSLQKISYCNIAKLNR